MFKPRTLFLLLLALLLGIWWFASSQNAQHIAYDRPNDPWVFRSVLDKKPRMITFALDDHLWAAYSTDSCSLYKVWPGGVDFEGAVYNMRHGPQPMSLGNAWFENKFRQPWAVTLNGKAEAPRTDYKGHRYTKDGHAEIMYDLVLASGARIRVNERPEMVARDGQKGFERTFRLENVPAGAQVTLQSNAASIVSASNVETNGTWKTTQSTPDNSKEGLFAVAVEGALELKNNEPTHLTTMFVSTPLIPNPFDAERKSDAGESAAVSPGERLMAKSDCRTCHNPEVKTVGPSYVDISERYKNTPENIEKLANKVMKGGSGVWGVAAMSAHPDLQPEDAKALVSYVLSFDKGADDGEGGVTIQKNLADIPATKWLKPGEQVTEKEMLPGLLVDVYKQSKAPEKFSEVNMSGKPMASVVAGKIEANGNDFGELKEQFALRASGYLVLEKDDNVVLQLSSDDGSRLYLDGQLLIDNDGSHGMEEKEAEVALRAGHHSLKVEYFQGGGGRGLVLKWARFGSPDFKVISESNFAHKRSGDPGNLASMGGAGTSIPGDGVPLQDVHPAYTLSQARPDGFLPKVAAMDFMPDGRLLVTTWDAMGAVYILDHVQSGDPKKITVKRIA
ncbi:MAG: PA14 domain-containing protein, partial [Bacteroidota bacterium]